jgi:1-acyl-sn-glycerol-3-phosphate acyltransferase
MPSPALSSDPHFIPYPRRLAIRAVLRAGIAAGLAALTDFHIEGRENLPAAGPLLIIGNHFNFLDPVAVIHITRYPLEFIGGRQAPNAPGIVSWFRNVWGILPATRGGASRDALLSAQRFLEQKGVMCIFPEGGSWASVLRPPRPGAALVAARSNVPLLPLGLDGFTEVFPSLRRGKRARVTVRIGKPFGPYSFDARDRSARQAIEAFGHEMMRRVAELIPPERRGYYSDDPTIRAAAKGTEIYPWDDKVEG